MEPGRSHNCSQRLNISGSEGAGEGEGGGLNMEEVANQVLQGAILPLLAAVGFLGR